MPEDGVRGAERGTLLAIRVTPRAARQAIERPREGRIRVRVNAPPADGAANEAVRKLLAKQLRVPRSAVTIERGESAREKTVLVAGLEPGEARARLARLWGAR